MDARRSFDEYPKGIRHAWAAWQAFRRLGFTAEQIYVVVTRALNAVSADGTPVGEELCLAVELRAQGRRFTIVAEAPLTEGEAHERLADWKEFATLVSAGELELGAEASRFFHLESFVGGEHAVGFVAALVRKGFKIPRTQPRTN